MGAKCPPCGAPLTRRRVGSLVRLSSKMFVPVHLLTGLDSIKQETGRGAQNKSNNPTCPNPADGRDGRHPHRAKALLTQQIDKTLFFTNRRYRGNPASIAQYHRRKTRREQQGAPLRFLGESDVRWEERAILEISHISGFAKLAHNARELSLALERAAQFTPTRGVVHFQNQQPTGIAIGKTNFAVTGKCVKEGGDKAKSADFLERLRLGIPSAPLLVRRWAEANVFPTVPAVED